MCSAGLGNILSDVAGVFLSERIEKVALKLGLPKPELTREQLEATSVSVSHEWIVRHSCGEALVKRGLCSEAWAVQ